MKSGVVVGGTGAQGAAVVRQLSSAGYHIKVLSRSTNSPQAQELKQLPNVELLPTSPTGHDDASFLAAAQDADFAWINTDGFSIGEVAETYWGIRFYELSCRAHVKHYIYSSLDNLGPRTGFDPRFMVGHYNGKARVVEYLRSQPNPSHVTSWSAISSGPYAEMLSEALAPSRSADGTFIFTLPLNDGAMPFIHLADYAKYVQWIIENPSRSVGHVLEVATALVQGSDMANAFSAVTGEKAKYLSIPISAWIDAAFKKEPHGHRTLVGRKTDAADAGVYPMTFGQNFTAWWNVYQHTKADGTGLITRDFHMLDQILPTRVKSVEEWMRKVGYTGEKVALLKRGLDQQVEASKEDR